MAAALAAVRPPLPVVVSARAALVAPTALWRDLLSLNLLRLGLRLDLISLASLLTIPAASAAAAAGLILSGLLSWRLGLLLLLLLPAAAALAAFMVTRLLGLGGRRDRQGNRRRGQQETFHGRDSRVAQMRKVWRQSATHHMNST